MNGVLVDRADLTKIVAGFGTSPPDNLFDLSRIPPGSYIAYAWWWGSGGQFIVSQPVEVRDQDIDNLVLSPAPAIEIRGSVELKPASRQVDLRTLSVEIRPIYLAIRSDLPYSVLVKIGGDLKFRFPISSQPNFVGFAVKVSRVPEGCYIASIQYGGKEVPDSGIDYSSGAALAITVGADGARVDGNTLDKDDNPFEGAVVALIPMDGTSAPRSMISGSRGAFHLAGVPPGEYKLMAWDDVGRDDLEIPDFLKRFESQGTPVKLSASGTATVSIRVISQETAH
jgi:hypothetical protein